MPEAWLHHNSRRIVFAWPPVHAFSPHPPRTRSSDADDTRLSDLELYFVRPDIIELKGMLAEQFLSNWMHAPCNGAGRPTMQRGYVRPDGESFLYESATAIKVYAGKPDFDPRNPDGNAADGAACPAVQQYVFWRRRAGDEMLHRLLPVPVGQGSAYFWRVLIKHVAARSHAGLLVLSNGSKCDTPEEACRMHGLLSDECEVTPFLHSTTTTLANLRCWFGW